ncbi:hypothetical protein APED_32405 [Acanthopleuribacter pedis]
MTVTRVRRIAPPDDFPYPSTVAYGRDAYGIWQTVAVAVAGVEQTFRWCPPGRFLMGSPQSRQSGDTHLIYNKAGTKRGHPSNPGYSRAKRGHPSNPG